MSDLVQVTVGSVPWKPASDAESIAVYDRHDFPISGVIEQHGVKHLFMCVFGHVETTNFWAYAPITDAEFDQLEAVEDDELDDLTEAIFRHRTVVVALAGDDTGIITATQMDWADSTADSLKEVTLVLRRWIESVRAADERVEAIAI